MPGEASVSPYTLVTFINIFSSTRFISSTGQSEPAIMPVRRLDISNISNMGWFSSAMNMVGTPYKAVQRSSGALAIGPVLQGLNKPVNDLSRGATVQDIINTIALTAIEAQ